MNKQPFFCLPNRLINPAARSENCKNAAYAGETCECPSMSQQNGQIVGGNEQMVSA